MSWNLKIFVKGKEGCFSPRTFVFSKVVLPTAQRAISAYFQCGVAMTVVASNWLPSELTGRLRVVQKQQRGGCGYWLPELQNLHIISVLPRRMNVKLHTSVFGGHVLFERIRNAVEIIKIQLSQLVKLVVK